MNINRLARTLVRALHRLTGRHNWRDTRTNPWGIVTEQWCVACNCWRFHRLEDVHGIDREPRWRDGKHPNRLPVNN